MCTEKKDLKQVEKVKIARRVEGINPNLHSRIGNVERCDPGQQDQHKFILLGHAFHLIGAAKCRNSSIVSTFACLTEGIVHKSRRREGSA